MRESRAMATPRLLAILWADLVDSTETVARLGPEAGEAWRQRFLAAMRDALAAARGREVQHTGDGLFAAFDSASDAVACAIGLPFVFLARRLERRLGQGQRGVAR